MEKNKQLITKLKQNVSKLSFTIQVYKMFFEMSYFTAVTTQIMYFLHKF